MNEPCRSEIPGFAGLALTLAVMACNFEFDVASANAEVSTRIPTVSGPKPTNRPFVAAKGLTSDNWAGYIVATNIDSPQNNAVTDVQGQWIVPSLTCGAADTASSIWIGVDGDLDKTVEQAGTEQDCTQGKPSFFAWLELYPKEAREALNVSVHSGDIISAEIKYISGDDFNLSLVNQTTGESFNVTQTGKRAKRQTAEWIIEAPFSGKILPLANFGLVTFTGANATLNGHSGPISDPAW